MPTLKPSVPFLTLPITRTASTSSKRSRPPAASALPPSFLKPTDGSRTAFASTARPKSIPKARTTSSGGSAGRNERRYRTAVAREEAIDQARRKAIELRAIRDGLIAGPEPEPEVAPKTTIGDAIDAYLRYVKMQRKPRTHLTYRYTLDTLLRAAYKKEVRRGRDSRRRARFHDLLLRAGVGCAYRLRQGSDGAATVQETWTLGPDGRATGPSTSMPSDRSMSPKNSQQCSTWRPKMRPTC
jgi:hypothetical protein